MRESSRTQNVHEKLFILKDVVSEKWNLETSVIQLLSSAIFFISVVKYFQHRLPKFTSFNMSNYQNYSLNFHPMQLTNGIIWDCIILLSFDGKCSRLSSKNFHALFITCFFHSTVWTVVTGKCM